MNVFEIFNETDEEIDTLEVKNLLDYALKYKKLNNVVFNVIFTDNETIRKINKEYRGIEKLMLLVLL